MARASSRGTCLLLEGGGEPAGGEGGGGGRRQEAGQGESERLQRREGVRTAVAGRLPGVAGFSLGGPLE